MIVLNSIFSSQISRFLFLQTILALGYHLILVDGTDMEVETVWKRFNGEHVTNMYWDGSEPNSDGDIGAIEDCAAIYQGRWISSGLADVSCYMDFEGALCERVIP